MRTVWVAGLFLGVALAGCASEGYTPHPDGDLTGLWLDGDGGEVPVRSNQTALPVGETLRLHGGGCDAGCGPLRIEVTEGASPPWLRISAAWDGRVTADIRIEGTAPDGRYLESIRGFDAARILLASPAPGLYEFTFTGHNTFDAEVHGYLPGGGPSGDELFAGSDADGTTVPPGGLRAPNLVTLVPEEIGVRTCNPDETLEEMALRCLRLGNGIGNIGAGPLEVHLAPEQGALGAAGLGRFIQRLYAYDGAPVDVQVHIAQFHFIHAHFHYQGVAMFSLWEHDLETGLRGEAVGVDHKSGFCLLDIGVMPEPDAGGAEGEAEYAEQDCLIPTNLNGWSMGISAGWFDFYTQALSEQYVEISGVPDGVYELVSQADPAGTLFEQDRTDNTASVILKLQGDDVEILDERGWYRLP